ncbi:MULTISPECIES: saccharopine dehydrogenase family protein [Delftia]|uniref:saccharopine dehydrogenase family protein n=1 Tax=Delftia TaxID=80865 RepID=UPI000F822299|nr:MULTISPECIES: saccharopine dehydrogenase NADP-binding domain-containing protein [Delftia]MCO5340215.1 saccharopine dehydrogenase NADP-binding domain-containing protein [Delftia tsuruhatensis]MCR4546728.1 saccharopine dehydrogenase NADP-binding domain-containing protein [Delftia tsuruhatensis]MDH0848676.1 saccharopine dehydrogenase NADP-binding domain-containing protein [Delftia tsuruhatensis]WEL98102.1 saccharopine dehydrogenase NADP-binding domain-containing protein [Delftia tsuruhatensis]
MTKPFDLVVHGATGFTGRLVVEYLLRRYPAGSGLRWAMGGRNAAKLAAVRDELGAPADTPLVVTDTGNPASLQALMEQARLVLTTVGPYQLYGNELVAACARAGVDYVDLCGEPAWMRQMIDAHEAAARASGARIVFSCGFDSIPFDLGVFMLQREMQARFGQPAQRVRGRVRKMKGTFSGGTAASLKATMAAAAAQPGVLELLRNPFSLTPGFEGPRQPSGSKPMVDEVLGLWVAPFVMAAINTRNVHRSNFLLGHAYGADFVYDEMMVTGAGEKGEALANAVAADKSLGADDGPKPGEGPSREERESGFYDVLFIGTDTAGHSLRVGVKGDRDPGYGSTSKMITEAAVCLLQDAPDTPGGIWTTAPAMGNALIARLKANAGLSFTVEEQNPS